MKNVITAIQTSAKEWNISLRTAWWMLSIPLIGAVLLAASRVNYQLFRFLTMEDGPIEWPQFFCFLGASIAAIGVAIKRLRAGHPWQGLLFIGFALATFVIAGEEISWGQRIFGWQTPEDLAAINHQGETTVHNIRWVQELLGNLLMVASGIAVALPFLNKKYGFAKRWDQGNFLFVPPLFLATCFGTMFLYKFVRLVAFRTSDFTVTKYGEWPELCFAAGLMLFAYLNYRRLSAPAAATAPAANTQASPTK